MLIRMLARSRPVAVFFAFLFDWLRFPTFEAGLLLRRETPGTPLLEDMSCLNSKPLNVRDTVDPKLQRRGRHVATLSHKMSSVTTNSQ